MHVQTRLHRTHAYAHFLVRASGVISQRLAQVLRVPQNHSISDHVSLGCPISFVSSDFLFTNLFSDATFRIIYTTDYRRKLVFFCRGERGECLATWPIRSQTQVRSPSSASMSLTRTRRSNTLPGTGMSRTSTTQRSPPLRFLIYLDIPELTAAASIQQQQAGFHRVDIRFIRKMASRKC